MASETMQRDPGDECDAAACSCGRPAERIMRGLQDAIAGRGIIHLFPPLIPTVHLPELPPEDYRIHMDGGASMTLAEIGAAIGVPGEDLVALLRGESAIVARDVQPEERKP